MFMNLAKPKASRYHHYDHFLANMSHMISAVIMINDRMKRRIDVNCDVTPMFLLNDIITKHHPRRVIVTAWILIFVFLLNLFILLPKVEAAKKALPFQGVFLGLLN
jgi:hypothetical protein